MAVVVVGSAPSIAGSKHEDSAEKGNLTVATVTAIPS